MNAIAYFLLGLSVSVTSVAAQETPVNDEQQQLAHLNACLEESAKRVAKLRQALRASNNEAARVAMLEDALAKVTRQKSHYEEQLAALNERLTATADTGRALETANKTIAELRGQLQAAAKSSDPTAFQASLIRLRDQVTALEQERASKSPDALALRQPQAPDEQAITAHDADLHNLDQRLAVAHEVLRIARRRALGTPARESLAKEMAALQGELLKRGRLQTLTDTEMANRKSDLEAIREAITSKQTRLATLREQPRTYARAITALESEIEEAESDQERLQQDLALANGQSILPANALDEQDPAKLFDYLITLDHARLSLDVSGQANAPGAGTSLPADPNQLNALRLASAELHQQRLTAENASTTVPFAERSDIWALDRELAARNVQLARAHPRPASEAVSLAALKASAAKLAPLEADLKRLQEAHTALQETQRTAAQREQALEAKLKTAEAAADEAGPLREQLTAAQDQREKLNAQVLSLTNEQKAWQEERITYAKERDAARAAAQDAQTRLAALEKAQQDAAKRSNDSAKAQQQTLTKALDDLKTAQQAMRTAEAAKLERDAQLRERQDALQAAEQALAALKEQDAETGQRLAIANEQLEAREDALEEAMQALADQQQARRDLDDNLKADRQARAELEKQLATLRAERDQQQQTLTDLQARSDAAAQQAAGLETEAKQRATELAKAQQEIERWKAQFSALQEQQQTADQERVQILALKTQLEQQLATTSSSASKMKRLLLRIDPIRYELNSADIEREEARVRDQVRNILTVFPDARFEISGHTCTLGSDERNLELSKQRARRLLDLLVNDGVDASQLASEGYGETQPVADNSTEDGRRQNRRVEIKVFSAQGETLLDTEGDAQLRVNP